MSPFASEFLAAAILVFVGSAIASNARLARTLGAGMQWPAVAFGSGAALALALFVVRGRACVDPSVLLAMWSIDRIPGAEVAVRLTGQALGAACGAMLAWVAFLPHWSRSADDPVERGPAIHAPLANLVASAAGAACLLTVLLRVLSGATLPDAGGGEPGLSPAAATPFIALHPGEGAVLAGLALAALLLGVGGTGAPVLAIGPALLPSPWRSAEARRVAWLRIAGPAAGAFVAAAIWRSTVG